MLEEIHNARLVAAIERGDIAELRQLVEHERINFDVKDRVSN